MITRRLPLAVLLAVCAGCPRAASERSSDPPGDTADPARGDEAAADEPAATSACGTEGLRLEDTRWLPASTRAVVMIDLEHPELRAALAKLATAARAPGHGLPIDLAFAFSEWTWQIPALSATLARAGLHPGTLAFVRTDEPIGAFVLPHDCDVDELRTRISDAWALKWRTLVEGALGRAAPGSTPPFAWDVLITGGGRVLLVAAGRGDAWIRALAPDPARRGVGAKMGEALGGQEPAPIRGVIAGPSLVDPSATTVSGIQTLRVTAEGVVLDDSLAAPP